MRPNSAVPSIAVPTTAVPSVPSPTDARRVTVPQVTQAFYTLHGIHLGRRPIPRTCKTPSAARMTLFLLSVTVGSIGGAWSLLHQVRSTCKEKGF